MGLFSRKPAPIKAEKFPGLSNQKLPLRQKSSPSRETAVIQESPTVTAEVTPVPQNGKRISTVVDDIHFADFERDDYDELDTSKELYSDVNTTDSSEDDEYEEHKHTLLERDRSQSISQLSALMGYCGLGNSDNKESLKRLANEFSKHTYSLLGGDVKIVRLARTMRESDPHFHDSVIGDAQLELLKFLRSEIDRIVDARADSASPPEFLASKKTLFERYGSVNDIIGRGAYGVIKIIDSGKPLGNSHHKVYAVKELQKRSETGSKTKESRDHFLERVISEFMLSSTLNNKHIVRTVDLMVTLPDKGGVNHCGVFDEIKFNQVMECSNGGNLFSYCKSVIQKHEYLTIDEVDCMVKQITKGLWYMHAHGVAHCDLKLENILVEYEPSSVPTTRGKRARMNLKISDFGKSNVVRTKWDTKEEYSTTYPIGSEPYMAPEEHVNSQNGISLVKKDCWALGVIVLILFNVRRSFYHGANSTQCQLHYYDFDLKETDSKTYGTSYLWYSTEPKSAKSHKYKDHVFEEYTKEAMISDYNEETKEWCIKKKGTFVPIETMFDIPSHFSDTDYEDDVQDFNKDDFDIRQYCTYKLLDMNPVTRFNARTLLKSDWLLSVESCGD